MERKRDEFPAQRCTQQETDPQARNWVEQKEVEKADYRYQERIKRLLRVGETGEGGIVDSNTVFPSQADSLFPAKVLTSHSENRVGDPPLLLSHTKEQVLGDFYPTPSPLTHELVA
jgi:hypothetical protein